MSSAKQTFRATIRIRGRNPYVDVPQTVSKAFRRFSRSGKVSAQGTLNGYSIRATLMPVRGGRHVLYVNGGMRSATGVGVGDSVEISLRPTRTVPIPADVAEGLRQADTLAGFEGLPASRRSELIRYIDDARTPRNRRLRIRKTAEHLLGKTRSSPRPAPNKPLWTCPKCGHHFVNKNSYHSCRRYTLEELFEGKPPAIRKLFDRFRKSIESLGPATMVVYRDKVGFMERVRFAGATPRQKWLDVGFWLRRRIEHPRFRKIETLDPRAHIYSVRITRPEELDDELRTWLAEAYQIGCQER